MPGQLVGDRRRELSALSRGELLKIYAKLPGRSKAMADRTLLSYTALIDIIIWVENDHSFDT